MDAVVETGTLVTVVMQRAVRELRGNKYGK